MNSWDGHSNGAACLLSSEDESLLVSPPRPPMRTFETSSSKNHTSHENIVQLPLTDNNDLQSDGNNDTPQQQLNETMDSNYGWDHVQDLLESDNSHEGISDRSGGRHGQHKKSQVNRSDRKSRHSSSNRSKRNGDRDDNDSSSSSDDGNHNGGYFSGLMSTPSIIGVNKNDFSSSRKQQQQQQQQQQQRVASFARRAYSYHAAPSPMKKFHSSDMPPQFRTPPKPSPAPQHPGAVPITIGSMTQPNASIHIGTRASVRGHHIMLMQ